MSEVYADRPGVNKWGVAVAVALGAMLEVVDTSIVNVALTPIQNSLGATLSQVSWVVSGYAAANVIILPLTAWLGDRFGKKSYFIFSLVGFTLSSMLCGLAMNLPMLVVARVIQGLAGGGLLAKAQAILFETFPKKEQPMAQAFFGVIVIAGPAIGPSLGGWLVTQVDWRWIFYVNLPIGIVALFMVIAFLPPDPKEKNKGRVDFLAIALLAMGLGTLQVVLEEGQSEGWFDSGFIVFFVVVSLVSLIFFVGRTLASDVPVVDLRVLRYRSLAAGSLLSIVIGMALYGALFAVPIFAQGILHLTAQETGMMLLPGALASAFMMPVAAKLISRFDPRVLLVAGGCVLVTAILQLAKLTPQSGPTDFFWPLIIRSFGTVLMFLPLSMAALGPIPKEDVGKATGIFSLTRQLGGSVGVALLSSLLDGRMTFHRAVIAEKLVASDPAVQARVAMYAGAFASRGSSALAAKGQALAALDGTVRAQASVISFADTFWATAALVVCTLPLVFLLGKPKQGAKLGADAH